MRTHGKRLQAMEAEIVWRRGDGDPLISDAEILELFKSYDQWMRFGAFDGEPDFLRALVLAREAVSSGVLSQAGRNPESTRDDPKVRELLDGFSWLVEILDRVTCGIPAVTESEFNELADWFREYDKSLTTSSNRRSAKKKHVKLGNGKRVTIASILDRINRGWRARGVGMLAVELRKLRGWG